MKKLKLTSVRIVTPYKEEQNKNDKDNNSESEIIMEKCDNHQVGTFDELKNLINVYKEAKNSLLTIDTKTASYDIAFGIENILFSYAKERNESLTLEEFEQISNNDYKTVKNAFDVIRNIIEFIIVNGDKCNKFTILSLYGVVVSLFESVDIVDTKNLLETITYFCNSFTNNEI